MYRLFLRAPGRAGGRDGLEREGPGGPEMYMSELALELVDA